MKRKVQLVLGSGGARGVAHIGVIQLLLEQGYEIVEVAGCSMGAVVGGMFCAGHLPQYTEWLLKQSKTDVYLLFDLAFSLKGLVRGERIFSVLEHMAGKRRIEELDIPFTAIATDILSRREVHFRVGDLYKALRASTGIPGVFTPIADEKCLYVDGGVLNPLPISCLEKRTDTLVVAVNLNGAFDIEIAPEVSAEEDAPDFLSRMLGYFWPGQKNVEGSEIAAQAPFTMFELMKASYNATVDRLTAETLFHHPPDILIEIPRNVCSVFEFYRAAELIEIGKKAYRRQINLNAASVQAR
jgi:NTE family protein